MHTPATGLSYYIWCRTKWLVIGAAIYLAALATAVQIIPAVKSPFVCVPLTAPLAAAIMGLVGTLTLEQVNFDSAASVFPTHLLIRPATNRSLVLWPMLYAATIAAGAVVLIDRLLLAQLSVPGIAIEPHQASALLTQLSIPSVAIEPHPLNPALPCGAAAFIVWLQVVAWFPIPLPFGRIVAFTLTNVAVFAWGMTLHKVGLSQGGIAIGYLVLIALAYVSAVTGVQLARRGVGKGSIALPSLFERALAQTKRTRPFRSPAAAQFFYECRRNLVTPFAFACAMCLFALSLSLIASHRARITGSVNLLAPNVPFAVTAPVLTLAFATAGPMFIFMAFAVGLGKNDFFAKETRWPSFITTRPFTSSDFVLAKLKSLAACAVVVTLTMFVVVAIAWHNFIPSDRDIFLGPISHWSHLQKILLLICAPLGIMFVLWRSAAIGLFITLTGRANLIRAFNSISIPIVSLVAVAGYWVYWHPWIVAHLKAAAPWVFMALASVKIVLNILIFIRLDGIGLMSRHAIKLSLAAWLLVAVALAAAAQLFTRSTLSIPFIILAVPMTRLAAAPLALHWNRHR